MFLKTNPSLFWSVDQSEFVSNTDIIRGVTKDLAVILDKTTLPSARQSYSLKFFITYSNDVF